MLADWIIIDGNNLAHSLSSPAPVSFDAARCRVVREVDQLAGTLAARATVVFDGLHGGLDEALRSSAVDVLFSHAGETADGFIERMVSDDAGRTPILVVTSDHAEATTVAAAGAEVMSCRRFLEQLGQDRQSMHDRLRTRRSDVQGPSMGDFFPS